MGRLTRRTAWVFHDPVELPGVEFLVAKRGGREEDEEVFAAEAAMARRRGGGEEEEEPHHDGLRLLEVELGRELGLRRKKGKGASTAPTAWPVRVVGVEMRPSGRTAVVWLRRMI